MSGRSTDPVTCLPDGNRLFAGMDAAIVRNVLSHAVREKHKAGGPPIFKTGDKGDSVYLIQQGFVRIYKQGAEGGEETLAELRPGDCFGEMAMFGDHLRAASASPQTDCVLWRLPFEAMDVFLEHNLELTKNLLDSAHRHLRAMDERFLQELIHRERLAIVGRMAASIVHDLKGPLSAIRLSAELIGIEPGAVETVRRAQLIVRGADQLTAVATELLDYCRGAKTLVLKPTSLTNLVNETLEAFHDDLEKRNVRLKLDIGVSEPIMLDPQRMQRVILNLVINAADAMPAGGLITVHANRMDNWIVIEISDTGHGIPPHQQAEVWKPFVSIGKKRGTGLGLPIARKIVEDHGGSITLRSEVAKGTTFSIRLPVQESPNPA